MTAIHSNNQEDKNELIISLKENMAKPTNGVWQEWFKTIYRKKELEQDENDELKALGGVKNITLKALGGVKNISAICGKRKNEFNDEVSELDIINEFQKLKELRNSSAHGAVKSLKSDQKTIEKNIPTLYSILSRFTFLGDLKFFEIRSREAHIFGIFDYYFTKLYSGFVTTDYSFKSNGRYRSKEGFHVSHLYLRNDKKDLVISLFPFIFIHYCHTTRHLRKELKNL